MADLAQFSRFHHQFHPMCCFTPAFHPIFATASRDAVWNLPCSSAVGWFKPMKKLATALLSGALRLPCAVAAQKDQKKIPQHTDPYVNGAADENRIAKEVRH